MLVTLTGASGFIGSYTAKALADAGHEVRALVRNTSRRDHIEDFVTEFAVGTHDDPAVAHELVRGADAIIHNSVDWHPLRKEDINAHFRSNLLGTLTLLEAARQAGCSQFVFVSSVATHHEIVTTPTIVETHPLWPGNLYGAYKAAIEPNLKAYHTKYGMNTSAWRPAAVYGVDPNLDRSQWRGLIQRAAAGEPIETDRGGKITHVQDVADALTCAIGDDQTAGQVYNLVDQYLYWQRVAELAKEIAGSDAEITDRTGTGPANQFDTAKAEAFFDRHGKPTALRRGEAGVRAYVAELLEALSTSAV
ncbi:MAG: NAD(P)-dependent oxidoreductase [Planctomycetota bacterium]